MVARVVAVANRKGGVGKTTTAVNVAAELASRGHRVLVVDLDSQGHASLGLGVGAARAGAGAHRVFRDPDVDLGAAIQTSRACALDVLPPEREPQGAEPVSDPLSLARALAPLAPRYDYIVIDTSPAVDVAMVAALAAADRLLIPTQLQYLAYDGVAKFARVLFSVATRLNRRLADFAVVPVQIDMRVNLQRLVLARLLADFGRARVFRGIRSDVALAESFGSGTAVRYYRPQSRGAADYAYLTDDILSIWKV